MPRTAVVVALYASSAIMCAESLPAQSVTNGARDSTLAVSAGLREWPTLTGSADGLALGLKLRTGVSWLRLAIDAQTASVDRQGRGRVAPYLLDGRVVLSTRPVRAGRFGIDGTASLERDAFDPSASWMQQGAAARAWYGSQTGGVWARAGAYAPHDGRATPTSGETQLGAWLNRGTTEFIAQLRNIETGHLSPVGPDSADIDLSTCRLDYDARRPLQQYRTLCPERFQTLDAGVGAAWNMKAARVHVFAASRLRGEAEYGAPRESWLGGSVDLGLTDNTMLTIQGERRPTDVVRGTPAHERFSIAVQLSPGLWKRRDREPVMVGSTISGWRGALALGFGEAITADVRGDFTDWKPVHLERSRYGTWWLPWDLAPGVYKVSVRLDGGPWRAPTGLPTADDGFGGVVGVIVVS